MLINAAFARKRSVISALIMILIAGMFAYITIPKESDPDVNIPIIYVSMFHQGISPEDAERLLIRPMEQELASVEGIKEMTASGYLGGANVVLEFTAGFDADQALDDVREAVDKAKVELPEETDEPTVSEVNFSLFPVLVVTLSGNVSERALVRLARGLQDRIEAVPEVLEVEIGGDREELVEIILDPSKIQSYGLRADELIPFFRRSNQLVAAGRLDTGKGRFAVKVPGLFENVSDIRAMPVKTVGDSVVTLGDIAEIRSTFRDRESYARLNGQQAVALEVVKRSGENIISTIEKVKQVVAEEQQYWPESVEVTFSQDRSNDIRTMLSDLQNNILSAIILVMIVVIAALGVRSAGLVGISVPGSFLLGILVIYIMGLTVNVVVLFALILAVGMLVDGAVVVVELADRKMVEGKSRKEAYLVASKRMAWPIIASTATTLAAFLPLLFWPGLVGEFMKYLPITLIAVLSSSLIMALVFVPVLGSLFGGPSALANPEIMKAMAASEGGDVRELHGITGRYVRLLDRLLRHPTKIVIVAISALVGTIFLYGQIGKGVIFFPEIEPENIVFLVHARGNLSIEEQDSLIRDVERRILDIDGFKTIYTRAGLPQSASRDVAEDVIGQIQIELEDWENRPPADVLIEEVRRRTENLQGYWVEARKQQAGPGQGKPIEVQLASRSPERLAPAMETLRQAIEDEIGGVIDIEDSRPLPGIEWELQIDRAQAAKFAVDVQQAGSYIRLVTNGLKVTDYRPQHIDEEIDIVIRYPVNERSIDALDDVRIETAQGSVPISNFITKTAVPQVSQINRADQMRVLTLKADVPEGGNVAAKVEEIKAWVDANPFHSAVQVSFKGEDEDQREAQEFLMKAFVVALFLMALILLTQFDSFYSMFLILLAVVMSTVGVLLGLIATAQPFGIVMTGVGVIALAGIVVNNNIVLIDTFDNLRKNLPDNSAADVILRTGAQRLRPVMLTTITTILGLIPMVLQVNINFITRHISVGAPSTQWWVSLATAVCFGLAFATLLTLILTPCLLQLRANVNNWWAQKRAN